MWIDVNSPTRHFRITDYHLTINGLGGSNTLENDSLFALVDSIHSVIAGLRISMPGPTVGLKQAIHHRALQGQIYDPCARQIPAFLPSGPTFRMGSSNPMFLNTWLPMGTAITVTGR